MEYYDIKPKMSDIVAPDYYTSNPVITDVCELHAPSIENIKLIYKFKQVIRTT